MAAAQVGSTHVKVTHMNTTLASACTTAWASIPTDQLTSVCAKQDSNANFEMCARSVSASPSTCAVHEKRQSDPLCLQCEASTLLCWELSTRCHELTVRFRDGSTTDEIPPLEDPDAQDPCPAVYDIPTTVAKSVRELSLPPAMRTLTLEAAMGAEVEVGAPFLAQNESMQLRNLKFKGLLVRDPNAFFTTIPDILYLYVVTIHFASRISDDSVLQNALCCGINRVSRSA